MCDGKYVFVIIRPVSSRPARSDQGYAKEEE